MSDENRFGLPELFALIQDRELRPVEGSYTCSLLMAAEDRILKRVGEEVIEVIVAAKGEGRERMVSEVADLFYHLLVLLAQQGITLADVEAELARRHGLAPESAKFRENR